MLTFGRVGLSGPTWNIPAGDERFWLTNQPGPPATGGRDDPGSQRS